MEPYEITQIDSDENKFTITAGRCDYIGVYFDKLGFEQFRFCRIACPCGVEVVYPINGLPAVDTLHPCGKPNHWTVKFGTDQPTTPS